MNKLSADQIKDIQENIEWWFGVILSEDQIVTIFDTLDEELQSSILGGFDTCEREAFIDALSESVCGMRWPMNCEKHLPHYQYFEETFYTECKKKGFKLIKMVEESPKRNQDFD